MIVQANALHLPLRDASVHAIVTSPPYWAMRSYEGEHQRQAWPDGWLGQLGLEPTPELYLGHLVAIADELWRVLRPDGSLWWNLGDAYANDGKRGGESAGKHAYLPHADRCRVGREKRRTGRPDKSLLGLPWRCALMLAERGWTLRSEVIWHKPTAMPESVRDRPTRAHEHVFLMAKSPRYYYDDLAMREAVSGNAHARGHGVNPKAVSASSAVRLARDPRSQTPGRIRSKQNASFSAAIAGLLEDRRIRTVWTIAADHYRGAHYACFPRRLAQRCIAASTSECGVCPRCGAPWARVVERQPVGDWARDPAQKARGIASCARAARAFHAPRQAGWAPTCACDAGAPVRAVVLDPFGGSGTVGEVAVSMGRRAVLVDLAYQHLQRERLGLLALAAGAR